MRHRLLHRVLAAGALVALACPAAVAAADAPAMSGSVRLSDERLESRWAHAVQAAVIFAEPRYTERPLGRLRFFTEDHFPEVYIALQRVTDDQGRAWVQVRIPKRPNGQVGWVPRAALGEFTINRQQLTIDRTRLRAVLRDRGKVVWRAPVGIGAPGTPTPPGDFYVREKFRFDNVALYGTRAIGTSAYAPTLSDWPGGGVVGIHGTSQPELIPGRPSHGCVRVRNPDVERLWKRIRIGTPIRIV